MRVACGKFDFLAIVLVLVCSKAQANPASRRANLGVQSSEVPRCGYQACSKIKHDKINVHIVPHTHDDVGWLKTVDQYYFGSKSNVQKAGVQYILDSVLEELKKNPARRFIWVETAYLWKWWKRQDDAMRHRFQTLVRSGQLEMTGGGWSMNDEAATHYQSIVDQFTWGLRKLNDTFGECGRPRAGWQIDPFGHSREMAHIFTELGFDGLLLGRIDYQDKMVRFTDRSAEMMWRGTDSSPSKSSLFTSVMYNTYSPPPGFCWDLLCDDDPIIDDKKSPDYNVDKIVERFLDYVKNLTMVYTTGNVLITMGEDFNYQDAHVWFKNLDKLILYANKLQERGSPYHLIYSTPSCYLSAVAAQSEFRNLTFPLKSDDFFPYASDPHSYWTGYFTSRPSIKRYERTGNNLLQVCKQQYALADLGPEDRADLNLLREAMGVMQHHDAITGTEKENVAHDYARILSEGLAEGGIAASTALGKLVTRKKTDDSSEEESSETMTPPLFESCLLANVSQCEFTEKAERFVVTVYNPLSRPVNQYVRLPVVAANYQVRDPEGGAVIVQLIPVPNFIAAIPGRNSSANVELLFLAQDLPPLGFKSYWVEKQASLSSPDKFSVEEETENVSGQYHHHKYGSIGLRIDRETGLLVAVSFDNLTVPLQQNFFYYEGAVGNNEIAENRSSGAYIFRPNGTQVYTVNERPSYRIVKGDLVIEVWQKFSKWLNQIVRLYATESFVEFDWVVGPIPQGPDDINGKEIITRFKSDLHSKGVFYTDSNGRQMLKRVRNSRNTWKLNSSEPVSANYYPVTSKIAIRDEEKKIELAVLNDRAQGGSSLSDGELELMVHRRCLHDDAFGVGEALKEEAYKTGLVVRGSHFLIAGSSTSGGRGETSVAALQKDLAQRKLLSAWTFVSPVAQAVTFDEYKSRYVTQYSGLKTALPNNVQILTLEPWKGESLLLRLEHVFQLGEDPVLSQKVTVSLEKLFTPWNVIKIEETTLGANQWKKDAKRLIFPGERLDDPDVRRLLLDSRSEYESTFEEEDNEDNPAHFSYVLNPGQIRTFVIDIKRF